MKTNLKKTELNAVDTSTVSDKAHWQNPERDSSHYPAIAAWVIAGLVCYAGLEVLSRVAVCDYTNAAWALFS